MSFTECMKSELDLFSPQPLQTNILKTEEVAYKPITSLENQSVIEFASYGHGDSYLDLNSINIRLKIQVVKADGQVFKNEDENQPTVVNNMLHSLFRQVNIVLNGKNINSTDGNYSYRAYIESLLNHGNDSSQTHLEMNGWSTEHGNLDDYKNLDGAKIRTNLTKNSSIVEVFGRLHADMLNQPLLLLNNVDLKIILTKNKPEFYMLSEDTDEAYVKILEATLYIKHVSINPNILIAHHKILEKTNAKYHYKRTEIKSFTLPPNSNSISLDNVVLGNLPSSLIFLMVDNDAYTGRRSKNPFNFKHNKISSFALYVNGVQIPNEPIETNFVDGSEVCARAYSTLFEATGILHTSQSNLITKEMFSNGYFMLAFDLTPDMSGNSSSSSWLGSSTTSSSMMNQGNIRLEARFSSTLSKTITCLAFMEFDTTLEIDRNRNVILN